MTQLIQYASLRPAPWKNGGGSTTEIAVAPPGAGFDSFDWRISLATISHSGPFSTFAGIDRSPVAGARYWLEDVTLSGARTSHGPAQAGESSRRGLVQARAQTPRSALLSGMNTAAQSPAVLPATTIAPIALVPMMWELS